jgi:hypothetical protein
MFCPNLRTASTSLGSYILSVRQKIQLLRKKPYQAARHPVLPIANFFPGTGTKAIAIHLFFKIRC